MASYVQIANLAAELIGTDARLTSPDDDRVLARNVKAVWDLQRRATIGDGSWNFATRRDALPALADAVPYPFSYAYQLPSDALRLLEVLNDTARDSYQLEGGKILCDTEAPLYVRCLVDIAEPGLWDDGFADAFAKRIAFTIGKRIAGSTYDATMGWRLYQDAINDSKAQDARENPPIQQEESSWIEARLGGRWY